MSTGLLGMGIVIFATFISAFGPIFMKKGSEKFTINPARIIRNPALVFKNYNAMLGCGFFFVSSVIFVTGLRFGELSVLYPLTSLSYIWTCLLSTKLLNERMNRQKWLGIAVIIAGVALIGLGRSA